MIKVILKANEEKNAKKRTIKSLVYKRAVLFANNIRSNPFIKSEVKSTNQYQKRMKNFLKMLSVILLMAMAQNVIGQGVFTSNASGNWSDPTKWTLNSGTDADGIPDSDDNVTIAASQFITLTANSACNNLTLLTTSGENLDLLTFTLEVSGTMNGPNTTFSNNNILSTTGRIKFIGNSRALFGSNWAAVTTSLRFEVALTVGQIGTASTNIKAKEIIATTGTFDLGVNELRPDDGFIFGGILTIETGGLLKCLRLSRTGIANTPFAAFNMNGSAKLQLNSSSSTTNYLPAVQSGFPVYTLSNSSTIEYVGSSSGTISVIPYKNLTVTLNASSSSRTFAAPMTIDGNLIITTATVSGNSGTVTINGNLTLNNDGVITFGSNGAIFNGAGTNVLTVNSGGILEAVNRSLTLAAAGATTPLSTSYTGWETLTLNTGSTVSYAIPGGATACSQDIQTTYGGNPLSYQNLRIRMTGSTTSQSATHYVPVAVSIAGLLSIFHSQGGSTAITTTHNVIVEGTGTLTAGSLTVSRNLAITTGSATSTFTLASSQDLNISGISTFSSSGLRFTANSSIIFGGNVTTGNGTNAGSTGTIFNFNGFSPTLNFNGDFTDGASATTFSVTGTEVPFINFNNGILNSPKIVTTTTTNINVRGAVTINGYRQVTGITKNFRTNNASTAAYSMTVNGTLDLGFNSSTALNSGGGTNVLSGNGTIKLTGDYSTKVTGYSTNNFQTVGTLHLNGASGQDLPAGSYQNIIADNIFSVSLIGNATVNGSLSISRGSLITGANNLTLGASASATIGSSSDLSITGGTTNFASRPITLESGSASTGRIAAITGDNITTGLINATAVTIQRFIPGGRRTNRFLSHPFTTTLNMGSLIDNIYITGAGTGFDATATNNPSSFWFNTSTQAWTAFTSTSDNNFAQHKGIRVLIRGDRNQPTALTGGAPTPNAVTIDMTGTPNTGAQSMSSLATGFHVLGNPYPSPTDIGTVINAQAGTLGVNYWVWDANASPTAGAYVTKVVATDFPYHIAMNAAFVINAASTTTLSFAEANKASSSSTNLFRTTAPKGLLELQVLYKNYPADNLFVSLNENAATLTERLDGTKLTNPEVNFYTLSSDNKKLSLDARPLDKEDVIKLGLTTPVPSSYTIKVARYGLSADAEMYLKDKYTNTLTKLDASTEYEFTVSSNTQSQGENRFELVMKQVPMPIVSNSLEIKISPNPVNDQMYITYNNPEEGNAVVRISNASGQVVKTIQLGKQQQGNEQVSMKGMVNGVYNVELTIGKERITKQVVKQ